MQCRLVVMTRRGAWGRISKDAPADAETAGLDRDSLSGCSYNVCPYDTPVLVDVSPTPELLSLRRNLMALSFSWFDHNE